MRDTTRGRCLYCWCLRIFVLREFVWVVSYPVRVGYVVPDRWLLFYYLGSWQEVRLRVVACFVGRRCIWSWIEVVGAVQSLQDLVEELCLVPQGLPNGFFWAAGLDCIADHGFDAGVEVREGWARFELVALRGVDV
jgi:hypothetical protein